MADLITRDDIEPEEPEPERNEEGYQVGRGKPPRDTQFKPGNKRGKGRVRGSKNFKTIVNVSIGVQTGPPIGAQKGPPFTMAQG